MTQTRTTEATITELYEAAALAGGWLRLSDVAAERGLTAEDIRDAVLVLMDEDEAFRAEPEPFGHRITAADKAVAPVIGGEARHLIRWN